MMTYAPPVVRRQRMVTAVIGAGPAGLLFTFVARVLARQAGCAESWTVRLFDKRASYERSHRLRMDPQPYRAIGRVLDDPGYEALLAFLESQHFKPAVSALEEQLLDLVAGVDVAKERLCIGVGEGTTSLVELRGKLEADGDLSPGELLTIVAADSVHSDTRELVRGSSAPRQKVHQLVARLKIEGEDLPAELALVEQLKLSKLIGSIMDYRKHPAGHAEVDLFLGPGEHRSVDALGANPKTPVVLEPTVIATLRAPLFRKIVEYFRDDFAAAGCKVTLWSSFVLEHKAMDAVTFAQPDLHAQVLLVGDAAISLPFFRGMASLARCVLALAEVHVKLAAGKPVDVCIAEYQRRFEEVRDEETGVVEARARLIRGAREFVRISALLPFPFQSWFLSLPSEDDRQALRVTPGVVLNLGVALASLTAALTAPLLAPLVASSWTERLAIGGSLYLLCAALQLTGGLLYRHTQNLDAGSAGATKRLWTLQTLALIGGGVAIGLSSTWRDAGLQLLPALSWLLFGACFAAGMLLYESLERRWWPRAQL